MYRAYIKNFHPFYKPDDDDINKMLFGSSGSSAESELDDLMEVPEIEGLDDLSGNDLDAALAALLAADGDSDDSQITGRPPADTAAPAPAEAEQETNDILTGLPSTPPPPPPAATIDSKVEADGGADIDALLAALGGGDDRESISGEAPAPSPPPVITPGPQNEDDLLKAMLDMDTRDSSNFELKDDILSEPVQEVNDEWAEFHYNPAGQPTEGAAGQAAERIRASLAPKAIGRRTFKQRVARMSVGRFLAVSAVILLVILGSGYGVLISIREVYAARIEEVVATAHLLRVDQPEMVANYSYFVPLNELMVVDGRDFFLRRLSFGQRATTFHFEDVFNPDDYTIVLHDQEGNLFKRNINDITYGQPGQRGTVLQFSSLLPETRELTLSIQGRSGVPVNFQFLLENGPEFPAAIYVNARTSLFQEDSDTFLIDNAVFSNTSSEIVYLKRYDPIRGSVSLGPDGIRLREGARDPAPNRPGPAAFPFPEFGRELGRITYGPIRNLDSIAHLDFRELFVSYPMPAGIVNIPALFRDTPQDEQHINIGEHRLILERMGVQGPFVILVLHGLDYEGERIHTELAAELVIETETGPVVIAGQNFFSTEYIGTDLLFDTRGHGVDTIRVSDMRLDVRAVQMRVDEAGLTIPLDEHDLIPAPWRVEVEQAIEEAFASRLAYRAGAISFSEISGFSSDVVNDRAVMRHYSPILAAGEDVRVLFDARVVAGAFAYADLFLAVVEEEWVIEVEGSFKSVSNTHQVAARLINDRWVVVSNRVV